MTRHTQTQVGEIHVSVAVGEFLNDRAMELSPYSVRHLKTSLEPMVEALGDPPVASVQFPDLRRYLDDLYLRYRATTLKSVVGDLRQFWRWAKKRGYVDKNPAKRLKPLSTRLIAQTAEPKAPPDANIHRLFDYMTTRLSRVVFRDLFGNLVSMPNSEWTYSEREHIRDLFILSFLYETGCRAGELWRLSRRAMDEAVEKPGSVYRVVTTGKTGSVALWFTQATAELWFIWCRVRPEPGDGYAVVAWREGQSVGPMSTNTMSRMISRRCERAGVEPFRAHALRHAKVQRGVAAVGLETVSRLVGHASAITTVGYAGIGESQLQAAAAATGLKHKLWDRPQSGRVHRRPVAENREMPEAGYELAGV